MSVEVSDEWTQNVVAILTELNAEKLSAAWQGGNDSGNFSEMTVTLLDGSTQPISQTYGHNYKEVDGTWVNIQPLLTPDAARHNMLYNLLWMPISDEYGSFGTGGEEMPEAGTIVVPVTAVSAEQVEIYDPGYKCQGSDGEWYDTWEEAPKDWEDDEEDDEEDDDSEELTAEAPEAEDAIAAD